MGYMGKILKVNLSDGTVKTEKIDMDIARKYLGGKGYAVRIFYDYLQRYKKEGISPRDINPFGEENVLIFATGPATGIVGFPKSGRYHVMALRSPLTGSIASANSGGRWGPFLKFAGFDMIVIEGKSEEPVYLEVLDGHAEIKCAKSIWGMNVFDTERTLKERVGERCSVACIGPAGENLVYFANIMNDEHRAAGRTGVGAVMGSKKLKAIVVGGNERPQPAKPDEFDEVSKEAMNKIKKNPVTGEGLPKYGTAILVNVINNAGILPFKNWQTGVNPEADKISGETLAEKYLIKNKSCWGCAIGCGRVTAVKQGCFQILYSEGPEYESIWALGNSTGVMQLDAVIKANHLCDELGLDTISMGSTIACAMELVEKGYIPEELLEGVDLRFGNAAAMVEMIWRTAYKSGFGKYLALGSKRLAEMFGAPELSMSVKGLELPAYDPRGAKGIGLTYATANRGGCHVTGYTISPEILGLPEKIDSLTIEGKAQWVKTFQDFTCVVNSTVNCLFSTFALGAEDYAKLLSAVTGWNLTTEEVMKIGERIYNLERLIINEYGFNGKDDTLPKRLLQEPMPEGPAKGHVVELDKMKEEYYKLRGWVDGKPTPEKLKELDIP
ncbi:aldehyde ferredoxin oxidoreductase family protein [Archaeoglobus profundus]|uniref:Aldehyde ferredoxin oxidoreductase n=1 Tax=Archaeoglobus profundus (strain DSM 5631 / JCM 9629 / NBRC 100127 / Av18) TaxID=572546 RepID=D2RE37_ARCPA|nr:aldehyde ferredoxin oxidoreductase family protein [Archaeoglobus profundus]ADB58381.1 Aldehyde ferredoxin oxidoreductase [Archaeoglobus profundus DSM 5631]